jgi:hypothetical protein
MRPTPHETIVFDLGDNPENPDQGENDPEAGSK